MKIKIFFVFLMVAILSIYADEFNVINIDFNSQVDSDGNSSGVLRFEGTNGFEVFFTDDDSAGSYGGDANGVHITNQDYGLRNDYQGTSNYVIGALNNWNGSYNYHSSGIIATFNQGARKVSFLDTDDDGTWKKLYAYNQDNELIGMSHADSRTVVSVEYNNFYETTENYTGDELIYKVEFDTYAGTAGGSNDGTYFTIDDFYAEANPLTQIEYVPGMPTPEVSTFISLIIAFGSFVIYRFKK